MEMEKLVGTISKQSGKSAEEVKKLISDKQTELSGLVSEEGAAYIVGRELGCSLLKDTAKELKVKNLVAGMRSVDITVKVTEIQDPRTFNKNGKEGKVQNLIVGDETGTARFSFWNDELDRIKEIKAGDVLKLTRGYAKLDYRGSPELRLGKGSLEKSEEKIEVTESRPAQGQGTGSFSAAARTTIDKIKEGDFPEIRACMIQIFRRKKPFYEVCPECGKRAYEKEGKFTCKDHGEVTPAYSMVVSGVLDDGTGNIRAVFFRDMAEKLFDKSTKELKDIAQKEMNAEVIYEHFSVLGKEFIFRGRVKRNDMTESIEMTVNDIQEIDVKKEAEDIISGLEKA
ncbi:MAG: hypothetical protein V3V26_00800 [Candidatus Aenigmarchaeota archaeon]